MIFVMDLIKTGDTAMTSSAWEEVCRFLSRQPGYVSGRLLETIQTLHPRDDFKLSSAVCWETNEAWQAARRAAKSHPSLVAVLPQLAGKFTAFNGRLDQGSAYNPVKDGGASHGDQMVLVDVVYLDAERMKGYAEMWHNASEYMSQKPGYIGACLHVTTELSNQIKYINIAEWRSREIFLAALSTPEFLQIVKEYQHDFCLYLSRIAKTVGPEVGPLPCEVGAI